MKKVGYTAVGILALTMGAQASLLTQEESFASTTDWTHHFTFNQFDASLGTLNSVTINLLANVQVSSSVKNNAAGTSYFSLSDQVNFSSTVPSASPLTLGKEVDLSYSIPSGTTVSQSGSGTASAAQVYTGDLSAWLGLGSVIFSANTLASFSYSISGGNNSVNIGTSAGLDATVNYDYTPVPEGPLPLWASLGGLVMVFGFAAKRQNRLSVLKLAPIRRERNSGRK